MPALCLYFQVHQPYRIKKYRVFDIGNDHDYFNDAGESDLNNEKVFKKVSEKSYLPANEVLLNLLTKYPGFKVSFSLSGVVLEQIQQFSPKVLKSFQKLAKTGQVEFLSETYHHSLSFFYSKKEFENQVKKHKKLIYKLFGKHPKVFRNTELAYNNDLAKWAEDNKYKGILAEGWDGFLGWRSPNFVYSPYGTKSIKLLLKNYRLSDDIAFRFGEKSWSSWPLTAEKFATWVNEINGNGQVINLFMDYETFGEHQWADKGIFEFLKNFPKEILRHPDNSFVTVSEAVKKFDCVGDIDVPNVVTWADTERDLSAWIGNSIQKTAISRVFALENNIKRLKDRKLIDDWKKMTTSDHFYYMCTKWFSDGDVHKYFNPYETPYDAFISFMNVIADLEIRIKTHTKEK